MKRHRTPAPAPAPVAVDAWEESWLCSTEAPIDPDTVCQEADTAHLTRTAEDALFERCMRERAEKAAAARRPFAFIITIFFIIIIITGAGTLASAFTQTAPALAGAPATGESIMANKIEKPNRTPKPTTPAQPTAPQAQPTTPQAQQATPATAPAAPATAPTPTLAELLARVAQAQKETQKPAEKPAEKAAEEKGVSLTRALKRALMGPKTGTTECVIYSTLYAAIRIEEVITPAPAETQEEESEEGASETSKRGWELATDARRVAFLRELRNVSRGRCYNESITHLLEAISSTDDDYLWETELFKSLDEELRTAIKERFEAAECTEEEREEARAGLDPQCMRVTLHTGAIRAACDALATAAPEWGPLVYEERPAPATLRTAILELQYCIFPIDSSPRARVFRGLDGIDFKSVSTPEDFREACKAASLRAGEPSPSIPPEARARIMQWRAGTATVSAAASTTAARLAAVWGMD